MSALDLTNPATNQSRSIGCFGLGTIGLPIADRLRKAGFAVAAADPDPRALERWSAGAGPITHAPAEADIVITCVTDERSLENLLLGAHGLAGRSRASQLFIDHTTTSPALARDIAKRLAASGAAFVDAPVSGAAAGARDGRLSVFAGGASQAIAAATPILSAYAARITHLGPAGSGQAGKLANQIAIAGCVRGLTESIAFARAAGLDIDALLTALAAGSARSDQLSQHAATLADRHFTFREAFAWLAKDLDLVASEARGRSIELPQTALIGRLLD